MIWVLTLVTVVLLAFGFPMYLAFLVSSLVALIGFVHIPLDVVAVTLFDSLNRSTYLAIPFFILSGDIMTRGRMTSTIVHFIRSLLGRMPGSMGVISVLSCAFFGALSGSASAAVASVGKVMYPAMMEDGYGEKFTSGLITSSGTLAIIIPPSIAMIIYASVSNCSVGKLFIGGIIPGLIITAVEILYILWYSWRRGIRSNIPFSLQESLRSGIKAIPTLLMPVFVLGGIYSGVFTPTEAAIMSVFYALFFTKMMSPEYNLGELWRSLKETAKISCLVTFILACASVFSVLLVMGQVPQYLVDLFIRYHITRTQFMIILNVFFLIVGGPLDTGSCIVALMPLLSPLIQMQGIDPIHFGVIMTINTAIGMFSPPFGVTLFTTMAIFKPDTWNLYKGLVPFTIIYLICLALISWIPSLSLWLPSLMVSG